MRNSVSPFYDVLNYITVYNLSINSNYRILAAKLNYRFTQLPYLQYQSLRGTVVSWGLHLKEGDQCLIIWWQTPLTSDSGSAHSKHSHETALLCTPRASIRSSRPGVEFFLDRASISWWELTFLSRRDWRRYRWQRGDRRYIWVFWFWKRYF